ncbi:MAG: DUF2808 domain-containing protein [Gloeobacterales cyanobacterium]
MYKNVWLSIFALGCLVFTSPTASASEDKSIASKSFETALKLTGAYAINDTVQYAPTSYQFTIQIPPTAKQLLAQLTIDIPDDNFFGIELPELNKILVFNPKDPESLLPHYSARNIPTRITLKNRTVVFDFESPLSPGQSITIEFTRMRNPEQGGTYLLGINALPFGEDMVKQFVGYGRLVFRDDTAN